MITTLRMAIQQIGDLHVVGRGGTSLRFFLAERIDLGRREVEQLVEGFSEQLRSNRPDRSTRISDASDAPSSTGPGIQA